MTMKHVASLRLAALALALTTSAANAARPPAGPLLPDRLLRCSVGRVTNFDVHKEQTAAELTYDGVHSLVLFLPGIPVHKGHVPDATEDAGPVDPRTRIVSDPDGIAPQPKHRFDRVIDLWPDRVEMTSVIEGPLLNAIVLHPIDVASGHVNLFMVRASELTHFDPDRIYQGDCVVTTGAAARVKRQ